jgi:hypothetical protein
LFIGQLFIGKKKYSASEWIGWGWSETRIFGFNKNSFWIREW